MSLLAVHISSASSLRKTRQIGLRTFAFFVWLVFVRFPLRSIIFVLLSLEVEESSDDLSFSVIVIIISFFWVYVTQVELLRNGNGGARIPATRQGAISAGNARA